MSNPNNAWAYNAPLPPGFTPPPQPPPRKSALTPPAGKSPKLALAMVCVMALQQLAAVVTILLGSGSSLVDSVVSSPAYYAIIAADLLVTMLAYLQFVLPGWEPRRKILGWLLGLSMLGTIAQTVYLTAQGAQIGIDAVQGALGDPAVAGGIASVVGVVMGVFSSLLAVAMHPFFYLLLGIWTKKSMEKVAGVFACIALGSAALLTPLGMLLTSLSTGQLELPTSLWTTTLPGIVSGICTVIFYFTWPVLDKPVLAK